MFPDGGGSLAQMIREASIAAVQDQLGPSTKVNDIYKEDPFRHICELITFRQNIFNIILAAQILGPEQSDDSDRAIIAETRAVAVVYRDSYTGRYFIRSIKWLQD